MTPIFRKKGRYEKPWRRVSAKLAVLGLLVACRCAVGQMSVDTIGGGVRVECGPSSGFTNGNTYETAQFNAPYACALDTNGNLWIADKNNSDLEQVTQAGNKATSTTIEYYTTTGHTLDYHSFTGINGVAVDPANNLYALLPSPPTVVQYGLTTQSTFLNSLATLSFEDATADATAIAVDGNSNVFLAFTDGSILRVQMLDSNPPPSVYLEDYTPGISPAVHYIVSDFDWSPSGLALLADGRLAVSDTTSNAIYVVSTNDDSVPVILTGGHGAGFDDGSPAFAQFNHPIGLAGTADGSVVVCDSGNNRVRAVDSSGNASTLYGTQSNIWPATCCYCHPTLYAGWVDGVAGTSSTNATGREPAGVAVGPDGSLFVTELYYSLIRQVTNTSYSPVNLSAAPPVAITKPATGVVMNGSVFAGDIPTYYYFEWGTTTNYNNFTATNLLTTGLTSYQDVTGYFTNLLPATTYHFQLVAYSPLGTNLGGDETVFIVALPAFVATQPATNITAVGATLNAIVNPENSPTLVNFLWGTSTNFTNSTSIISLTNNLTNNQTVSTTISGLVPDTLYFFEAVADNSGGLTNGNILSFLTGPAAPPTLSFSPSNGYYPDCITISVTSSVPTVYYTTDGSVPTTNSTEVANLVLTGNVYVGSILWCNPSNNLTALQLLAFNGPGVSSTTMQGASSPANLIGFPQTLSGGSGGHLYVPVVVDLESNTTLQSIQFRVEVTPNAGAPMVTSMDLQPLTANDFIVLPGPAPADAAVNFDTFSYTTSSNGQGLLISTLGNNSGLSMTGSGVIVLLHFAIPSTATVGETYSLSVLDASGTSDGKQGSFGIGTLPIQTLTITDPPYLVGDSSPGYGYNAGQFGDGALDNADVNNAIYASAGIRVPPTDSDVYNSMDAWPPDSAGHGGDGFIRLLDWETILGRSVGLALYPGMDTNNYIRFWSNGDVGYPSHALVYWGPDGPPVPLSLRSALPFEAANPTKLDVTNPPPGLVWFCQAAVSAGTITNALPGNTYSFPVSVSILPGYSLSALQFRSIVTGPDGQPAVSIQFNPAGGVPSPMVLPGLSGNDTINVWGFGSFATPLKNSNYLGTISFTVPAGAAQGANYAVHFSGVDGAPDSSTEYNFESHPGSVWVMSQAQQPASITSDEWKIAFFGSLTNSQAGDDVDADGDGALNWQEYLAGTNPTNSLSCLQFSSASLYTNGMRGIAINWLTAPGKTYTLQSSAALEGAQWSAVNTNSGDGNEYQFIITNVSGGSRFYQIRLQP